MVGSLGTVRLLTLSLSILGGSALADPAAADLASADDIFDQGSVRTYYVTVDPADWEWLQQNALLEEYVPAAVTVEGVTVNNVGIRYKGHTTLEGCFDAEGNRICPKLSIKLKADEYVDGQEFFGVNRLNFNSMVNDRSRMRERLAYSIYRGFGFPASRATHAQLVVNGEALGLFSLVEQVEEQFLENHFAASPGGNLYKATWTDNTDAAFIRENRLKTNKAEGDVSGFIALAQAVGAATSASFRGDTADLLDLDMLTRYWVATYALSVMDDPSRWFCFGSVEAPCTNGNNYYWYEHPGPSPRMTILPWDFDLWALRPTPASPLVLMEDRGVPAWNVPETDCSRRYLFVAAGEFGVPVDFFMRAANCDPLARHLRNTQWEAFVAAGQELLAGAFELQSMLDKLESWEASVQDAVLADPHGPTEADWQADLAGLRDALPILVGQLTSHLSSPPPGGLVVVNEVVADSQGGADDFMELLNTGGVTFDLSGYSISDDAMADPTDPTAAYVFPSGTVVAPDEFLIVSGNGATGGAHIAPFSLESSESLLLYDPEGTVVDAFTYEPEDVAGGASFGRFPDGASALATLDAPTPLAPNELAGGLPSIAWTKPEAGVSGVMPNPPIRVSFTKVMAQTGSVTIDGVPGSFVWTDVDEILIGPVDLSARKGQLVDVELDVDDVDGNRLQEWFDFQVESALPEVVVNELVTGQGSLSGADGDDWVELKNTTASPIDLGAAGYVISDDSTSFAIPPGTLIPAGGYLVILANDQSGNTAGLLEAPFKLGSVDVVQLRNGAGTSQFILWQAGDGRNGTSFRRVPDGTGNFTGGIPSPGGANSRRRCGLGLELALLLPSLMWLQSRRRKPHAARDRETNPSLRARRSPPGR